MKILISFNIIDICTRLEVLRGLKLSGHTNNLTEASNLVDELSKKGEIQNKQQFPDALDKFYTNWRELARKLLEQKLSILDAKMKSICW